MFVFLCLRNDSLSYANRRALSTNMYFIASFCFPLDATAAAAAAAPTSSFPSLQPPNQIHNSEVILISTTSRKRLEGMRMNEHIKLLGCLNIALRISKTEKVSHVKFLMWRGGCGVSPNSRLGNNETLHRFRLPTQGPLVSFCDFSIPEVSFLPQIWWYNSSRRHSVSPILNAEVWLKIKAGREIK